MGSYNLIQDRVDREDYRIGWRKKMKVKVPIGQLDVECFQDLANGGESFTWTFEATYFDGDEECGEPIDIVFIKDEEEDE